MAVSNITVAPLDSGATIQSAPQLTGQNEIRGVFLRDGEPIIGARAYAYYAGEEDLLSSAVVQIDGTWRIIELPTTALYDIRFLGRDASPSDWLYDVQAYIFEEAYDVTPPISSAAAASLET